MRVSKHTLTVLCLAALAAAGCRKTIEQDVIVDNVIYGIDTIPVYASSADKDRFKTPTQFVSTLYSHLYLQPIHSTKLAELSLLQLAHGDKGLVNELIVESFLADEQVQATFPTDAGMRSDPEAFLRTAFLRFFLRHPTAYESHGLVQLIESEPDLSVMEVYRAFLLSNEYYFY